MQVENKESQSPVWVGTGYCDVSQQQKSFLKYVKRKRRSKENIGVVLRVNGNLTNKEEEKVEVL